MKAYIIVILIFFGVNTVTKAQSNKIPTVQELTVKDVTELNERLKLSATQKSVIYNYTFNLYGQQMELFKKQQAGTSKEEDISKFYKLQNETNDNIRNLLKGEQLAEFEKVLEDRLNGVGKKKKKKNKKDKEEEEVATGISGLKQ
jgi:protein CpxP